MGYNDLLALALQRHLPGIILGDIEATTFSLQASVVSATHIMPDITRNWRGDSCINRRTKNRKQEKN